MEAYRHDEFAKANIPHRFVQENRSGSHRGTLRGMHYQVKRAQGKLVHTVVGEIFDVAIDLRRNSPSFGKWLGIYLSAEKKNLLWIPPGFAHGFYVTSEWAEVVYKVTHYYAPEWERTLLWDDPQVDVDWPLIDERDPTLSVKDAQGNALGEAEVYWWGKQRIKECCVNEECPGHGGRRLYWF